MNTTTTKLLPTEAPTCPVVVWEGCYGERWTGTITDDSFKHPAKFSKRLVQRILQHGLEHGYWNKRITLVVSQQLRDYLKCHQAEEPSVKSASIAELGYAMSPCDVRLVETGGSRTNEASDFERIGNAKPAENNLSASDRNQKDSALLGASIPQAGIESETSSATNVAESSKADRIEGSVPISALESPISEISTRPVRHNPETPLGEKEIHEFQGHVIGSGEEDVERNTTESNGRTSLPLFEKMPCARVAGNAFHSKRIMPSHTDLEKSTVSNGCSRFVLHVTQGLMSILTRCLKISSDNTSLRLLKGSLITIRLIGDNAEIEPSIIGDPFGGVACGGIEAAYAGLRWIGLELEPKFIGYAQANIALHVNRWLHMRKPIPQIVQGDSRRFDIIISEALSGAVTSPPYATGDTAGSESLEKRTDPSALRMKGAQGWKGTGQTSEDNIACAANGTLDAALSSPPYDTIHAGAGGLNHLPAQAPGQQTGRNGGGSQEADQRYGTEDGQIARCGGGELDAALTSPPYAHSLSTVKGNGIDADLSDEKSGRKSGPNSQARSREGYGDTEGQIERTSNGELDAALTSPPWEDNAQGHIGADKWKDPAAAAAAAAMSLNGKGNKASQAAREAQFKRDAEKSYGESEGQIGKTTKESYWSAMRLVYEALFRALKPGGVAAIVVKDYCRKKKRVCLCDDTLRLLCFVGFTPIERAHAMLEAPRHHHHDMFSADHNDRAVVTRKSFFRRVHEAKPDAIKIDWEEVLFVRKPL